MKKLLTIAKDSRIKVFSQITDYLLPIEVDIPINENAKMLISNKNVMKGEALFSIDNKVFYSPISGKIIKIEKLHDAFKNENLYLKIKNDFQENDNYSGTKEFTTVTIRTDFPKKIKECPNFNWEQFQNKKELVINGIEDEPYIANKPFLHKIYTSEIFQMLDLLRETFKLDKVSIYLKENDRESIEAFNIMRGTYPNIEISILPDVYPIGHPQVLTTYLKLGSESLILSTEVIYDLYHEIVKSKRKDTQFVTITGNAINNPQVVNVKIGTRLEEVVKNLIEMKDEKMLVYLNGLMTGQIVCMEDIVITEDVRVIYFMKDQNIISQECIECGKCIEVCPLNCNPYRSFITKGIFTNEMCIKCGLCTFICPSKIALNKYLGGKKHE